MVTIKGMMYLRMFFSNPLKRIKQKTKSELFPKYSYLKSKIKNYILGVKKNDYINTVLFKITEQVKPLQKVPIGSRLIKITTKRGEAVEKVFETPQGTKISQTGKSL